jgi:hypothetical protein
VKPELERMLRESSEDFAFPETPAIVDALAPALRRRAERPGTGRESP